MAIPIPIPPMEILVIFSICFLEAWILRKNQKVLDQPLTSKPIWWQKHSRKAPSYESELNITIEEGYNGVTKNVTLNIGGNNRTLTVNVPKGILPGKKN